EAAHLLEGLLLPAIRAKVRLDVDQEIHVARVGKAKLLLACRIDRDRIEGRRAIGERDAQPLRLVDGAGGRGSGTDERRHRGDRAQRSPPHGAGSWNRRLSNSASSSRSRPIPSGVPAAHSTPMLPSTAVITSTTSGP